MYIFLLSVQYLLLLTIVLVCLNCCAVDLTFKQTGQRGAGMPVDGVVWELGILWTKRINLKRKVSSSLCSSIQYLSLLIIDLLLL